MPALAPARRLRSVALVMALTSAGVLIPSTSALATVVNPASGGTAIPADQAGTTKYTPLDGPAIAESSVGELTTGSTTILDIPGLFRLDPSSGSVSIGGGDCDMAGKLKVTSSTATFTVTRSSSVSGCIVRFVGLEVQPTSGQGYSFGSIRKSGTSAAPGGNTNYGSLGTVAGAVRELQFDVQPSTNAKGGAPFADQPSVVARDQFGNAVPQAPVRLSIAPGTGPSGAHLTCTSNLIRTDGNGFADFAGCRIDRVGRYRLRATSGRIVRDSGNLAVTVGVATRIAFLAYPAATTGKTLAVQPRLAVTDAGGNVVKDYPATKITIAINRRSATFTCSGGLSRTTVHGVAQFTGCKQTTAGTGYRLTGWVGFAGVTGGAFTVR